MVLSSIRNNWSLIAFELNRVGLNNLLCVYFTILYRKTPISAYDCGFNRSLQHITVNLTKLCNLPYSTEFYIIQLIITS
jgi:hypothetical protein